MTFEIQRCPVCGENLKEPCRSRLTGRALPVKHEAGLYLATGDNKPEAESVKKRLEREKRERDKP